MAKRKPEGSSAGPILYSIAALALSFIAWYITRFLSAKIPDILRILTLSLSILFSLLAVYIQYRKVYGKSGRMARLHRLRIRKGETKEAFARRKSASALWALSRSFILLFLWALLCWAAVSLLNVWLAAVPNQAVQYVMLFIAFGASLSLWAVADQFIP